VQVQEAKLHHPLPGEVTEGNSLPSARPATLKFLLHFYRVGLGFVVECSIIYGGGLPRADYEKVVAVLKIKSSPTAVWWKL
jgi:hypothetical protein